MSISKFCGLKKLKEQLPDLHLIKKYVIILKKDIYKLLRTILIQKQRRKAWAKKPEVRQVINKIIWYNDKKKILLNRSTNSYSKTAQRGLLSHVYES